MTPAKMVGIVLIGLVLAPAMSLLTGTILWLLWPVTAVAVWHLPPMTWWQCVAGLWTLTIIVSAFNFKAEIKS